MCGLAGRAGTHTLTRWQLRPCANQLLFRGRGLMMIYTGVVMVRCPATDHELSTGVEMDAATFERLPDIRSRIKCPVCNLDHDWSTRDAWLGNPAPSAPALPWLLQSKCGERLRRRLRSASFCGAPDRRRRRGLVSPYGFASAAVWGWRKPCAQWATLEAFSVEAWSGCGHQMPVERVV